MKLTLLSLSKKLILQEVLENCPDMLDMLSLRTGYTDTNRFSISLKDIIDLVLKDRRSIGQPEGYDQILVMCHNERNAHAASISK